MDIATALVFTHYVYYFITDRKHAIDQGVFGVYDWARGAKDTEPQISPPE